MKKKVLIIIMALLLGVIAIADHTVPTNPDEKPECTNTNKYRSIEFNSNATYKYDCQCDQGAKGTGLSEC